MRKLAISLACIFLCSALSFAQNVFEPDDPIYASLERYKMLGLIDGPLPTVRPWPLQVIRSFLQEVVENSSDIQQYAMESLRAQRQLQELPAIGSKKVQAFLGARSVLNDEKTMNELIPGLRFNFYIDEHISASGELTELFSSESTKTALRVPGLYHRYDGMVDDAADALGFNIIQDWESFAAFGSPRLWFQAGYNRTAAGPFMDNGIVFASTAPTAGHFAFFLREKNFSFTALHLALIGRNALGGGFFTNKHLDYRSYDVAIGSKLEFGLFESVIYGNRLELMYLVPFSFLFNMQGITGYGTSTDNSFIGVHGIWRPISGLAVMGELFVDDFPFNSFIRFDFNARYKLAAELGLAWAPAQGPLNLLKADYTAILPYMYSHSNKFHLHVEDFDRNSEEAEPALAAALKNTGHYSNYTQLGHCLGTDLLPNSERYSLRASLELPYAVTLRPSLNLIRHGNASEDYPGKDANGLEHRGDYYDNAYINEYRNSEINLANTWRFLTQKTIETRILVGLGADWEIGLFQLYRREARLNLSGDYVFEYGWNKMIQGLPVANNNGTGNYASIMLKLCY